MANKKYDWEAIETGIKNGIGVSELARQFNMPPTTIKSHIRRMGRPKKKKGRRSIKDTIHYEGVKLCYSKGFTEYETALALQVTYDTLQNWKKKDPDFFELIKNWKAEADKKVERSLYERACGYSCPETKAQWVNDEKGGRWEYAEMKKHYPPDATSMIFWLKNRRPREWRDKTETELSGMVAFSSDKIDKPGDSGIGD